MKDFKVVIQTNLVLSFVKLLKRARKGTVVRRMLFPLIYVLSYSNISKKNIADFFPEKTREEVISLNKKFFYKSLNHFVDFLNVQSITEENMHEFFSIKNYDYLEGCYAKKKGAVVVTGHFGNFLLYCGCAPIIVKSGAAFVLDVESTPRLRRTITKLLSSKGSVILNRKDWREGYKFLRNNGIFGLVADQAEGNKSVIWVDFLNRKMPFPIGPVVISYKSHAPILPTFILSGKEKYQLIFERPILVDYSKSLEANLPVICQQWAALLEEYIKKYPEQYFWRLRL
jgi:Kdo2-lipid IVA lauroyltransferase/acyltransferase